jgi:hypothetical protein
MGRTLGWTTTARETRMAKNRTTLLVYFVLLATRSFRCWHVVYDLRTKSGLCGKVPPVDPAESTSTVTPYIAYRPSWPVQSDFLPRGSSHFSA